MKLRRRDFARLHITLLQCAMKQNINKISQPRNPRFKKYNCNRYRLRFQPHCNFVRSKSFIGGNSEFRIEQIFGVNRLYAMPQCHWSLAFVLKKKSNQNRNGTDTWFARSDYYFSAWIIHPCRLAWYPNNELFASSADDHMLMKYILAAEYPPIVTCAGPIWRWIRHDHAAPCRHNFPS